MNSFAVVRRGLLNTPSRLGPATIAAARTDCRTPPRCHPDSPICHTPNHIHRLTLSRHEVDSSSPAKPGWFTRFSYSHTVDACEMTERRPDFADRPSFWIPYSTPSPSVPCRSNLRYSALQDGVRLPVIRWTNGMTAPWRRSAASRTTRPGPHAAQKRRLAPSDPPSLPTQL
ncbi:hypothetical protein QR680_008972 [Steinernema hermaphroditum]|uniref:Uncharacterized protein n=1 Tax=Steinernema hermaphroditum TaxID=289476 RepID=A0AA39IKG1_9BILA|nr:hypothetical protein QR680_008972 [Steinernema hermaphroditum]